MEPQTPPPASTTTGTPTVSTERTSTTTARIVETIAGSLKALIVGAMLFIPGLIWFMQEMNDAKGPGAEVHIGHVSFAVGLMVAGAIAIQPKFGDQITNIYVRVFPNGMPLLGGRRGSDPQPPTPPEGEGK